MLLAELNSFRKNYGASLFRAFVTSTDNLLVYILDKKPSRGPLLLGLDITFRCNFKCGYCSVDKMVDKNKQELTTEECIRLVREAGRAGVWVFSISGGEPLLRPDLSLIIKEAKKAGLNVNINTNASLLKYKAQELIDSGIDTITISVESHTPEIHDEIRDYKNSFKLILESIEEIKKLRKGLKPRIMVRAVITKRNYKILDEFIEYWKQYADGIILQPIHEGYSSSFFIPHNDALRFGQDDEQEFRDFFAKMLKKHAFLDNEYYREIPEFLFNPHGQKDRMRCFVSFFELVVDSYGDVMSCTEFIEKFGNIRNNGLMDIWANHQEVAKFRNTIKEGKQGCWCWYTCTGPFHAFGTRIGRTLGKIH